MCIRDRLRIVRSDAEEAFGVAAEDGGFFFAGEGQTADVLQIVLRASPGAVAAEQDPLCTEGPDKGHESFVGKHLPVQRQRFIPRGERAEGEGRIEPVSYTHLDAGQLDAAGGEVKTYVMNTQWMCGFPDKLVVASLDGYLISVFGAEDLVDTFRDKLQTAYPGTQIVSDDPIA